MREAVRWLLVALGVFAVACGPTAQQPRLWTHLGAVDQVAFGESFESERDYPSMGVADVDWGPATITLTDGSQLVVPEGTSGANACSVLNPASAEEGEVRRAGSRCVVIAKVTDGVVDWFETLNGELQGPSEGTSVDVGDAVRLLGDGRLLTLPGFAFDLAADMDVDDRCSRGPAPATMDDLLDYSGGVTQVLVEESTGQAVAASCFAG